MGLAVGLAAFGCAGPYAGKAERLKRPAQKKMPEAVDTAPVEIKFVEKCAADFQEEGTDRGMAKHKKGAPRAKQLADEGAELLAEAARETDNAQVAGKTKAAIEKLRVALLDHDPYSPDATYQLAVGYARARRKTCALKLLKRLAELEKYDEFTAAARGRIRAAEDDDAFAPFRDEAQKEMGR